MGGVGGVTIKGIINCSLNGSVDDNEIRRTRIQ